MVVTKLTLLKDTEFTRCEPSNPVPVTTSPTSIIPATFSTVSVRVPVT